MEAARKGDTTAVRAGLEKFTPDIDSKTVAFDAVHEACRGNHDECLALLLPYVETTQMGFGILLSECVHADHTACTEVLLQHWKSVCSNVAHVPLESEGSKGQTSGLCPAMWSDPAVCQVLIDAGADIETKDVEGRSPLHFACSSGSLGVVKMLVRAGAGVGVPDSMGQTCLMLATYCRHTETVRYLVGLKEVDVDKRNNMRGYTVLHLAVQQNLADMVKVFIDAGAEVEAKDGSGHSPLHVASSSGSLEFVKLLVAAGAGVRVTDNEGATCLLFAAVHGCTETVRYLVGVEGVEVEHTDDIYGRTALHWALHTQHADVVQVLIDAGANIEAKDKKGYSPLLFACVIGELVLVKKLVAAGAGVRVTNDEGTACLAIAASRGHTETVRYLVDLPEVEVDHADDEGRTALHWALYTKHADVVPVLIDAGADIEARCNDGYSPLLYATEAEELGLFKLLVRSGAGVCVAGNEGVTCLAIASIGGQTEFVSFILSLPEVDVNDAAGRKALRAAVRQKFPDVVQAFIDAGADVNGATYPACSLLIEACSHGDLVMVKKLVEAGARWPV